MPIGADGARITRKRGDVRKHTHRRRREVDGSALRGCRRSTWMDSNDAKAMAARNLIEGATLDELRDAVCDLRALSPDSALADLVEAKIEQLLAQRERTDSCGDAE